MITCFRCGMENDFDSNFCSNCGRYLIVKKEPPKRYDIKKRIVYRCPNCGAEGEKNFSHKIEVVSKQIVVSTGAITEIKCKKCGYMRVNQDPYLRS